MYSNKLICSIIDYIDLNLNRKITITELENHFFYNKYYIMKLFKKEIGVTVFEYINILRINNAASEIKNTKNSFMMIAISNGFYSLEYFSEIFKKVTGVSPRIYKKFWEYHNEIKESDLEKVRDSLVFLQEFIENKERYLKNIKPVNNPIKKLTVFK